MLLNFIFGSDKDFTAELQIQTRKKKVINKYC